MAVTPAEQAATNESLGNTPIKITRSMISGATDDELQKLHSDLSTGPNADSPVAGYVKDEVAARQVPTDQPSLFNPEPEQQPTVSRDTLFDKPPPTTIEVPGGPLKGTANNYVIAAIKGEPSEDPAADHTAIVEADKSNQASDNLDQARQHLTNPALPPEDRAAKAAEAISKPPVVKTLGEIYVAHNFPDLPPLIAPAVAQEVDKTTRSEEGQELQARIVTGDPKISWKEFMDKQYSLLPNPINLLTYLASGRRYATIGDDLAAAKDTTAAVTEKYILPGFRNSTEHQNIAKSALFGLPAASELKKLAPDEMYGPDQGPKFQTIKDFAQFVNPVPYDGAMEVHSWDAFKSVITGNGITDQFRKEMEDNYGPDWRVRWAAYMVKEVGVDSMSLMLAADNPALAEQMFAEKGASIGTRLSAALTRSMVMGTGGAAVQDVMDRLSGDDPEFLNSLMQRTTANMVGEGAVKAAAVAFKGTIGKLIAKGTQEIADRYNLKVMTPEMAKSLRDDTGDYKSPLAAIIARAATHRYSKEFMALQEDITSKIAANEFVPQALRDRQAQIMQSVSDLTGIPVERIPIDLAFGSRIYKSETFANIGRSQEFIDAEGELQKHTPIMEESIRKVADVEARIAKAQKRYDSVPIVTPRTQAQRATRMTNLQAERESIIAERDANATKFNELQSKVNEGKGLYLTTGNPYIDKIIQGDAMGFRLMGEITNKQAANQDMFLTHLMDNAFQFRPFTAVDSTAGSAANPFTWAAKLKAITRVLQEPDAKIFNGPAKDFFDAVNMSIKTSTRFNRMMDNALKGLSDDGHRRVFNVLREGAEAKKVFTKDELMERGVGHNEIDSYYAIRQIMDYGHMINDQALVNSFKAKGMKMYKDVPVNVIREPDSVLTADRIKEGYVRIVEAQKTSSRPGIDRLIKESELSEPTSVLPYIPGYVPIIYKNANYHTSIINMKNGTVKRVGAFKSMDEAMNDARQREAAGLGDGEMVVFNNWNTVTNTGSVGFTKNGLKTFQLGSEDTMAGLKEELTKLGIAEDRVRIIMDKLDLTDMRRRFIGNRAETRLTGPDGQPAPLVETPEAIAEYLQATANMNGIGQWRDHAIQAFRDGFDPKIFDNTQPWYSPSFIRDAKSLPFQRSAEVAQAMDMQRWLNRIITNKTWAEKRFDNVVRGWTYKMNEAANRGETSWMADGKLVERGTPPPTAMALKALAKVMDHMPALGLIERSARGMAVVTKLLGFNIGQTITQASQVAVTAGAHPIYANHAIQDLLRVTGGYMAESNGARPSKEAAQLLFAARKSGWINLQDNTDLMDMVLNKQKSWFNTARYASAMPFTLGEATNRMMAFYTVRRELMDLAGKRQLIGLDGKTLFRGKIDDDEFIRLVTNKAKIFALNMGKAGQLEALSGVGSVAGQFWQVVFKAGNIFETSELSGAEKWGAAAALTALFGAPGIPYMADLVNLGDFAYDKAQTFGQRDGAVAPSGLEHFAQVGYNVRDTTFEYAKSMAPEALEAMGVDKKFFDRLVSKGGIKAMTDGEWDITNRVALGNFLSQIAQNENPMDLVVSFGVASDLVNFAKKSGIPNLVNIPLYLRILHEMGRTNRSFTDVWRDLDPNPGYIEEYLRGDTPGPEAAIKTANEAGKVFSYMGYLTRVVQNGGLGRDSPAVLPDLGLNKETFDPSFRGMEPDETNLITTSNGKNVPVQATPGRLAQYLVGITPGPVVTEMDARRELKKYSDVVDAYVKAQIDKFNNSTNYGKKAVFQETMEEIQKYPHLLEQRGVSKELSANEFNKIQMRFIKAAMSARSPQPVAIDNQ